MKCSTFQGLPVTWNFVRPQIVLRSWSSDIEHGGFSLQKGKSGPVSLCPGHSRWQKAHHLREMETDHQVSPIHRFCMKVRDMGAEISQMIFTIMPKLYRPRRLLPPTPASCLLWCQDPLRAISSLSCLLSPRPRGLSWFGCSEKQIQRQRCKCKSFIWKAVPGTTGWEVEKWAGKGRKPQLGVIISMLPHVFLGEQSQGELWGIVLNMCQRCSPSGLRLLGHFCTNSHLPLFESRF